jgi:hypothetical protein
LIQALLDSSMTAFEQPLATSSSAFLSFINRILRSNPSGLKVEKGKGRVTSKISIMPIDEFEGVSITFFGNS